MFLEIVAGLIFVDSILNSLRVRELEKRVSVLEKRLKKRG